MATVARMHPITKDERKTAHNIADDVVNSVFKFPQLLDNQDGVAMFLLAASVRNYEKLLEEMKYDAGN